MTETVPENPLEAICENLVHYATSSEDLTPLIACLPETSKIAPATLEYEMRILKILAVGWGLAFVTEDHPAKTELLEGFWQKMAEISRQITETCASAGTNVDYFTVLNRRLDAYVAILQDRKNTEDPGAEIGLQYAAFCGDGADGFAVLAGKKVFNGAIGSLRTYLKETAGI